MNAIDNLCGNTGFAVKSFTLVNEPDRQAIQGGWDTPSTGCKSEGGCGETTFSDWFYDKCWKTFFY